MGKIFIDSKNPTSAYFANKAVNGMWVAGKKVYPIGGTTPPVPLSQKNVMLLCHRSLTLNNVMTDKDGNASTLQTVLGNAMDEAVRDFPLAKYGLFGVPNKASFSSTTQSGNIEKECGAITDYSEIKSFIHSMSPLNGSPLNAGLAELGLYMAGKPSFFWDGVNYTAPAGKKYIVMLLGGRGTLDSGVKGGFSSTSTAKYNMRTNLNSIFWKQGGYLDDGEDIDMYVTNKGKGAQISEFIYDVKWIAAENRFITGSVTSQSTGYSATNWARVLAGSPAQGHTDVDVNHQTTYNTVNANNLYNSLEIIAGNIPFRVGYNANNPSRPFPALSITAGASASYWQPGVQGYLIDTSVYQGNLLGDGAYYSDYMDDTSAMLLDKLGIKTFVIFMADQFINEQTGQAARAAKLGGGKYYKCLNHAEIAAAMRDILQTIADD